MKVKRILFTGSQATGKSTMVQRLTQDALFLDFDPLMNQQKILTVDERPIRFQPDHPKYDFVQYKIINHHMNNYMTRDRFISDRCIVDQIAFTKYAMGKSQSEFLKDTMLFMVAFSSHVLRRDVDLGETAIFYTPIEFDMPRDSNNELRPDDVALRNKIDTYIKVFLEKKLKGKYTILTEDVDTRYNKIMETIQ